MKLRFLALTILKLTILNVLEERFKGIDLEEEAPEIIMEMTRKLGFREDYDRFYNLFVKEVRDGKLGRYTLDIVGVDTDGDN